MILKILFLFLILEFLLFSSMSHLLFSNMKFFKSYISDKLISIPKFEESKKGKYYFLKYNKLKFLFFFCFYLNYYL
jgi:hypothetical protein